MKTYCADCKQPFYDSDDLVWANPFWTVCVECDWKAKGIYEEMTRVIVDVPQSQQEAK